MPVARKRAPAPHDYEELATRLFKSIASVLLRIGFDAPHAERMVREAFVFAAIESARASSRRATQSRVASIAGISRLDVRRILATQNSKSSSVDNRRTTRVERLLQGWKSDPYFLDGRGRPRALEFSGARSDFALLVRRYGRDVTARVLLEHLIRLRIVTEINGKLALASARGELAIRSAAAQSDLRFLTGRLAEFNWQEGRRTFSTAKVAIEVSDKKTAQLVRRIALERLETVLGSLGALKVAIASPRGRKVKSRVLVTASIAADVEEPAQ